MHQERKRDVRLPLKQRKICILDGNVNKNLPRGASFTPVQPHGPKHCALTLLPWWGSWPATITAQQVQHAWLSHDCCTPLGIQGLDSTAARPCRLPRTVYFVLIFKSLTTWLSELRKMSKGEKRGNKLMICSDATPDKIPDGAASLQWANICAHIQVSLEALVLTITTVPSKNKPPCGERMNKELSGVAPPSVNRPPARNNLWVSI